MGLVQTWTEMGIGAQLWSALCMTAVAMWLVLTMPEVHLSVEGMSLSHAELAPVHPARRLHNHHHLQVC